ncbi:peptidyl-prolyl cis-trans isomerase B (cyclophilin B) [Natranaerovirga hydrolytica]|uniref:Peptidyl-prolyl cis-trans isomerase n=1 Tax=Natranaerovirga hydrolytica TaxID=680378 RepID=A0A4R1MP86_9FIRM|nr:peptidylprolyl isomerase [Natranaerovirga hydrolytica]TCK93124.1 peptidyl-prolyl cis-trans isomerase B (cyclophilin B) [Natranaerovirga hydrolytica]
MKSIKLLTLILILLTLVGCGNAEDIPVEENDNNDNQGAIENEQDNNEEDNREGEEMMLNQFDQPAEGETVVKMHIKDYGVIELRLFPEEAPKTVENFVTHAKDGYYEGVTFHRVIEDFMIQGGDPTATGAGGESIWGEAFEDEFSMNLFPFRGALCMANAGPNTNGSQFFIVQLDEADEGLASQMKELNWPEEIVEGYMEHGGTPHLFQRHTVFGQVYAGMDVVDAIAATTVDGNDKPLEDVVIEKIEIVEY